MCSVSKPCCLALCCVGPNVFCRRVAHIQTCSRHAWRRQNSLSTGRSASGGSSSRAICLAVPPPLPLGCGCHELLPRIVDTTAADFHDGIRCDGRIDGEVHLAHGPICSLRLAGMLPDLGVPTLRGRRPTCWRSGLTRPSSSPSRAILRPPPPGCPGSSLMGSPLARLGARGPRLSPPPFGPRPFRAVLARRRAACQPGGSKGAAHLPPMAANLQAGRPADQRHSAHSLTPASLLLCSLLPCGPRFARRCTRAQGAANPPSRSNT